MHKRRDVKDRLIDAPFSRKEWMFNIPGLDVDGGGSESPIDHVDGDAPQQALARALPLLTVVAVVVVMRMSPAFSLMGTSDSTVAGLVPRSAVPSVGQALVGAGCET
jgi:hypothetical protein